MPQKQCPQCSQITSIEAQLCPRCSHRFRTVFAPPEQTVVYEAAKRCSNCGSIVTAGAEYCASCGCYVGTLPQANPISDIERMLLDIGTVRDYETTLYVSVSISRAGDSHVFVMMDSDDGRRREHTLVLDMQQFEELKRLVAKADQTLVQARSAGKMRS